MLKRIRTWLVVLVGEAVKKELDKRDAAIERELRSMDGGARGGSYDPARAAHLRRINGGS